MPIVFTGFDWLIGTAGLGLADIDPGHAVIHTIAELTLIQMLPMALAVTGLGLSLPSKLFLGWFGPRGIASILFALLILEDYPVPGGEELLACVVITVALSILLNGVTAAPLAKAYGEFVNSRGECAETKAVSEMPVRHGIVQDSQ